VNLIYKKSVYFKGLDLQLNAIKYRSFYVIGVFNLWLISKNFNSCFTTTCYLMTVNYIFIRLFNSFYFKLKM